LVSITRWNHANPDHSTPFETASEWGWIEPSEVPNIPKAQEARKAIQILSPEEGDALTRAALQDFDEDISLFVMFAQQTAMRHREIMCRRYDEIDWENCRIWIGKAKAGARSQPITGSLRDALRCRRDSAGMHESWIFPTRIQNANTRHRLSMAKPFRRVVLRAGLDPSKVTPHILRHTGISRLLMAGADIKTVQTISGHKTVQMVMHYAHVFAPHVDAAMMVLDRVLPDPITPELHKGRQPNASPKG